MESLQGIQDKIADLYKQYPRASQITLGLTGLYIVNKVYKSWKYSQKMFTNPTEIQSKAIIITGCDSGFGFATANKLSKKEGYRVIATCLKQESVDKFLSDSSFTSNGSTATIMDVTKFEDIQRVKQFTIKYLNESNSELWGLVNNAGVSFAGAFEMVPKEYADLEKHILYTAPTNITREFLPLIQGRKNYKSIESTKTKTNGGRIVNIASVSGRMYDPQDVRYGASKTALIYLSHSLRMQLSPKFGIWVCSVEPGGYVTDIIDKSIPWMKKLKEITIKDGKEELLDIYDFPDLDKHTEFTKKLKKGALGFSEDIDDCIDCIIHGLIAKYPERRYEPNWHFMFSLFVYCPMWFIEPMQIALIEKVGKKGRPDAK